MQYDTALTIGAKAGASRARGDSMLALVCSTLASVHAINPRLVYEGAKKQNLTYKAVYKLAAEDAVALGDLMFV
jgi:hypothetical protein